MFTLSIEHRITDLPTWSTAFDRFAEARDQAGVWLIGFRCPIEDGKYLVIELEFESKEGPKPSANSSPPTSGPIPNTRQPYRAVRRRGDPATSLDEQMSTGGRSAVDSRQVERLRKPAFATTHGHASLPDSLTPRTP